MSTSCFLGCCYDRQQSDLLTTALVGSTDKVVHCGFQNGLQNSPVFRSRSKGCQKTPCVTIGHGDNHAVRTPASSLHFTLFPIGLSALFALLQLFPNSAAPSSLHHLFSPGKPCPQLFSWTLLGPTAAESCQLQFQQAHRTVPFCNDLRS